MRAAILHEPGTTPVLGEHPEAQVAEGRSTVRVTAAPVVPLDLLCASGTSYFGRPMTPYVPGVQGVGVVARSTVHPAGTRVWFATSAGMSPGDGSLAELCSVADDDLVPVPADVRDHDLAALGLSAVAAWMALTWRGRLQAGEQVLVLGGGGAVGQSAIGAARLLGAGRVVAVCRPGEAVARARRAGADAVVELVDDAAELVRRLREVCDGQVDLVVDPVFGEIASAATAVLSEGGRLVNLGGAAGDSATFSSASLRSRSISILGYTNNALSPEQRAAAITAVAEHAANDLLRVAHASMPLSEVARAWTSAGQSGLRPVILMS